MFPSTDIDTFIYNPNQDPNSNPNPNPNSSYFQEYDTPNPLLFSNFPSPFLDDSDLLNPQLHHDLATDQSQASISLAADPPQKKIRKDRHSKICTAQGVRARRMRLPLQIARKFFDLQDMLGYDKASNTIEWLMSKSTGAIREITKNIPNTSNYTVQKGEDLLDSLEDDHEVKKRRLEREKARSRARERTREKMRMKSMTELGSSTCSHQSLDKQFSDVGINTDCSISKLEHENNLGGFDFNNSNSFTEFLGNWDVENGDPLR